MRPNLLVSFIVVIALGSFLVGGTWAHLQSAPTYTITYPTRAATVPPGRLDVTYETTAPTGYWILFFLDGRPAVKETVFDGAVTFENLTEGNHTLAANLVNPDGSFADGGGREVPFVVSATAPPPPPPAGPDPEPQPIRATNKLAWDHEENTTGLFFRVEVCEEPSFSVPTAKVFPQERGTRTPEGLLQMEIPVTEIFAGTPNTIYYIRVRTEHGTRGTSPWTPVLTVVYLESGLIIPLPPARLRVKVLLEGE